MRFLALSLSVAAVRALDTLNYGAFTQTATYSIANQLGFFTAYGVNVIYQQIPNSTFAYAEILNGGYDLLTGTLDNCVNLRFNSNKSITVIGQLDQGTDLVLAASPNITSISQLRGKPLIVDSPVSGYAYLLRQVLSSYGLLLENNDYYFQVTFFQPASQLSNNDVKQTVGGTNLRYADLVAGKLPNGTTVYATILTYPFTAEGEGLSGAERPNILARMSDFVNPVSSTALTVSQSAIGNSNKTDIITRFVAAMYAGNLFLQDPTKKNCTLKSISRQLNVSSAVAQLEYIAATNNSSGEVSVGGNFTVNLQGALNIIGVRKEFGGFSSLSPDFNFTNALVPGHGKLIDYSIRDAAVKLLKRDLLHTNC
ncbi:hypothetical protein BP5796_12097 [Coleophoma crateriformis]|uniref:SsuA/THI5-like domain-containing protein n=1 Tax=Coleophoma crateriformis TaxID=565419 RepID=A0A3D8QBF0_9HELO|nr:hypothetical protein BP5796_12097 [Coleophoma crateriformis]